LYFDSKSLPFKDDKTCRRVQKLKKKPMGRTEKKKRKTKLAEEGGRKRTRSNTETPKCKEKCKKMAETVRGIQYEVRRMGTKTHLAGRMCPY
jgi:hypothetical protein